MGVKWIDTRHTLLIWVGGHPAKTWQMGVRKERDSIRPCWVSKARNWAAQEWKRRRSWRRSPDLHMSRGASVFTACFYCFLSVDEATPASVTVQHQPSHNTQHATGTTRMHSAIYKRSEPPLGPSQSFCMLDFVGHNSAFRAKTTHLCTKRSSMFWDHHNIHWPCRWTTGLSTVSEL